MTREPFVVRNTARKAGRNIMITPKNSPLRALSCGRIILKNGRRKVSAEAKGREVALIALKGEAQVTLDGPSFTMRPYDALYLPPGVRYSVEAMQSADLAEASVPSKKPGDVQFVRYEDVKNDPTLCTRVGKETYTRTIYKLIDTNVPAARLLCGVTMGEPGNWTSWSPHEHASSKEEVYLYINMPKPGFGIQMLYKDLQKPFLLTPVFEDDAVIITKGFHPNVGAPGYGIAFVWMMAAFKPESDRDWNLMHWQEEFAGKY
jgi:5-deoxy-glucuronate isomerase